MRDIRNRNLQILDMSKRGIPYGKIAHIFDISRDRVRQIIKELEPEENQRRRVQKIVHDLRASNNIEKMWPRNAIIEALQLPEPLIWRLLNYFESKNVYQLSLRQFMDLLFANDNRMPKNPRDAFPICKINHIGFKTHSLIIHHLIQQDLGDAFNREWSKRLENLMEYLRRLKESAPLFLIRYSYPYP
jgi:hypothetical protein